MDPNVKIDFHEIIYSQNNGRKMLDISNNPNFHMVYLKFSILSSSLPAVSGEKLGIEW